MATRCEVVFVCTGNQARSPFAEAVLRQSVDPAAVGVRSIGTQALDGAPAVVEALQIGCRAGLDLTGHRARRLQPGELAGVDLVVGFEPAHISIAIVDGGADIATTFSLAELGSILRALTLEDLRGERPSDVIREAHSRRKGTFLTASSIADPIGTSPAVFLQTYSTIENHVAAVAEVIFE